MQSKDPEEASAAGQGEAVTDRTRRGLAGWLHALYQDDRRLQIAALLGMASFYGFLLGRHPDETPALNRTFNSMMEHLLHGRFDVDPATVGGEGFLRNGQVLAYWGIFCALLRLPLLPLGRPGMDVTVWSCLGGACLSGMMRLRMWLLVRRHGAAGRAGRCALAWMLVYLLLGGSGIGYLRASIYQEVDFWAAAFAAVFVYLTLKGLITRSFALRDLCWMACAAGLALLTRVSTGGGLVLAFVLLLACLAVRDASALDWPRALRQRRLLLPLAVLGVGLALAGTVNYRRWGNPLTFADHTLYLSNARYPDRMPRTRRYGYFNVRRIPFGLNYFFLPIWPFRGTDGRLLLEATQTRLLDAAELPPSSFLLTDLYPLLFLVLLARARQLRRWVPAAELAAVACGLAVPCVAMLMAISMNYRYRMEFYPEIDLLAFTGLYVALRDPAAQQRLQSWRRALGIAAVVSVCSAFAALALYKLSYYGPSQELLRNGIVRYYIQMASP
jgi:hypothetical protein